MASNPYEEQDKLHIHTENNGTILGIVEDCSETSITVEKTMGGDHYSVTLNDARDDAVGTIRAHQGGFTDTVTNIVED